MGKHLGIHKILVVACVYLLDKYVAKVVCRVAVAPKMLTIEFGRAELSDTAGHCCISPLMII